MVTLPAPAWRGGGARRALTVGVPVGLFLGLLAALDSGAPLVGVVVAVVTGGSYGVWMSRRMVSYWPDALSLPDGTRVSVVSAARRGMPADDASLGPYVASYAHGLRAAAADARMLRWVIVVVLIVAVGAAVWDAIHGTWGNAVASAVYLAALLVEILWWPKRRRRLLANADFAAGIAG